MSDTAVRTSWGFTLPVTSRSLAMPVRSSRKNDDRSVGVSMCTCGGSCSFRVRIATRNLPAFVSEAQSRCRPRREKARSRNRALRYARVVRRAFVPRPRERGPRGWRAPRRRASTRPLRSDANQASAARDVSVRRAMRRSPPARGREATCTVRFSRSGRRRLPAIAGRRGYSPRRRRQRQWRITRVDGTRKTRKARA